MRFLFLAALILLGCGSATSKDGMALFPIGLYHAYDEGDIPKIRDSGFDHVFLAAPTDKLEGMARAAQKAGMRVILGPEALMDKPAPKWPVSEWYIQDEPEVWKVSPKQLEKKSAKVRAWDSARKQVFVIGVSSVAKHYAHIADGLMLDWYPVPHLPLESVSDQIDDARAQMPAGKPLWFVVQAFDWRDEPQRKPGKRIGRFPDHREIRFMSWAAVIHGADGLFYFRLRRPDGTKLFELPELWQAVERVAREMQAMKPIIARGAPRPPPVGGTALESRAWRYRGRDYVVIANRTKA